MFKKVSILTLLLLFFVSTTGLPLTIQFCNMMDKKVEADCMTNMHKNDMVKIQSSCAQEETTDNSAEIKSENCCTTGVIISRITDDFVSNKIETKNQLITIVLPVSEISLLQSVNETSAYTFIDTSPPLLQSNHLYLSNSTLLI